MHLLKQRRTPWDIGRLIPSSGNTPYLPCDKEVLPEATAIWPRCKDVIYLRGFWLVDPARATSEDARQFMWAGLRTLRVEAKAMGLPEEQVDCLLASAFDTFHDAAESIWAALRAVRPLVHHCGSPHGEFWAPSVQFRCREEDQATAHERGGTSAPADLFVACEEDRPVPVRMELNKPLTLLDPDAEILASFEP